MDFVRVFWGDEFVELFWILRWRGGSMRVVENLLPCMLDLRTEFWGGGKIESRASYKNNQKHGLRRLWYANGQLSLKDNWVNGERQAARGPAEVEI